jgi:hypothetical protein
MEERVKLILPKGKKGGRKDNFSGFVVTINTNVSVAQRDDPLIETFRSCIIGLCKDIWKYIKVLDGKEKTDTRYFPNAIEIKPAIEVGSKYHKLHAHIVISLRHRSKIHLDLARIRNYLHQCLEGEGVKKSRVFVETFTERDQKYGGEGGGFKSIIDKYVEKDDECIPLIPKRKKRSS